MTAITRWLHNKQRVKHTVAVTDEAWRLAKLKRFKFKDIDANDNDLLDRDELHAHLDKEGVDPTVTDLLFDAIDANGDGDISVKEWFVWQQKLKKKHLAKLLKLGREEQKQQEVQEVQEAGPGPEPEPEQKEHEAMAAVAHPKEMAVTLKFLYDEATDSYRVKFTDCSLILHDAEAQTLVLAIRSSKCAQLQLHAQADANRDAEANEAEAARGKAEEEEQEAAAEAEQEEAERQRQEAKYDDAEAEQEEAERRRQEAKYPDDAEAAAARSVSAEIGMRFQMQRLYYSVTSVGEYVVCKQLADTEDEGFPCEVVLHKQQLAHVRLLSEVEWLEKQREALYLRIPSGPGVSQRDRLRFVFKWLSDSDLPVKKRVLLMQKALPIVDDEKTDVATAKFMVGAFKKCFTAQVRCAFSDFSRAMYKATCS